MPLGQYISALAVYCIAGDLSQLAGIQPPGASASSRGGHRRQKSVLCLTKHYSPRPPSVVINGGAGIINYPQIHRVMTDVTAPIGKLFLLTQHFFCLCCCLSLFVFFSLIARSVAALVHTAVDTFSCSYLCLHTYGL